MARKTSSAHTSRRKSTAYVSDAAVSMESILSTDELNQRPSRPPDYQAENRALVALAQELANSPRTILQKLVETALDLCQAGSAGVSLLNKDDSGKTFYWPAIAGAWTPHVGGGTPRDFGPCGVVLDRDAVQLFTHPERYYTYLLPVTPPIGEALLTPFYIEDKAVGTIWVIAHDEQRKFDGEDMRQIVSLGRFASAAYKVWESMGALAQQDEALRLRTAHYETLLNEAPLGVYLVDADFRIRQVNPTAHPAFGNIPDPVGRDFGEVARILWPKAYADEIVERLRHTLETGEPHIEPEWTEERRDGGVREFYEWRINRIPLPEGRFGVVCYFRDISAQVKARAGIAESEERLRFMAESMPQKLFTAKSSGEVDYFNQQWTEFTGLSFEQIKDWGWTQFIHPVDVDENVRRWQHSIDTGEPFQFEHRFRRADGEYRWHLSRAHALRDAEENVLMWIGSNTDIDDVKRAEESRAERARLSALGAEVGFALTQSGNLPDMLRHCVETLVQQLDAAFARIWTLNEAENVLELQASAGMYTHLNGAHARITVGEFKIGLIAEERRPHLTNDVSSDPRVHDQEWAKREGMVAFAGYPLIVEDRLVGVMAMFGRHTLTESTLQAMASVANAIALGIRRLRVEQEREQLLESEHEARQQAETANRAKDEFLATVSHELRTPLNAILGWAHMLKRGGLDEATAARGLEVIGRNAQAQNQLISDLLDVSRIITGQLRFEASAVELGPIIEAALDTVRPAADAKGVELRLMLDPAAGIVSGDAARLQQIVWNLLTNAVKYTSKNGHIDVRLKREDTSVVIIVSDTGEGIEPDFLPYVFDRFRQAEDATTRQHGGLGLGLAIVRHLVEAHGGTVHAASLGVGQGATFAVKFPLIAGSLD